ncbi:MAG TPA: hypothetical protein VM925_25110 [Labilithrix sp.]|nr:hypothetical protein [Labilithrix sp.]
MLSSFRRVEAILALVLPLAIGAACSLVIDSGARQCVEDADCAVHAGAVCVAAVCVERDVPEASAPEVIPEPIDPTWGCLGRVPPPPVEERSAPVQYPLRFLNAISEQPQTGLPVVACEADDIECTKPIAGPQMTTDPEGYVTPVVWSGFTGYFQITPTEAVPVLPSLVRAFPIPDKAVTLPPWPWSLFTRDELSFIAASFGKTINYEEGHVFWFSTDCSGKPAEGTDGSVETLTPDSFKFYTDASGFPSLTQHVTSTNAVGGFLNLPVGPVVITVRREGALVSKRTVFVRAGWLTYAVLGPN